MRLRFQSICQIKILQQVCKYVDQKESVAMQTIMGSADVAPEVHPRNPLQTSDKEIYPGLETQGRCNQQSIIGALVALQNGLMCSRMLQLIL